MKTPSRLFKKLNKKIQHFYLKLIGRAQAKGLVNLTLANAQMVYKDYPGVKVQTVEAGSVDEWAAPVCLPEDSSQRLPFRNPRYEAVVLDITSPGFFFSNNHLLDDQLRVVYEPNLTFEMLPIRHQFLGDRKRLQGTIAYLSNTLTNQYGHWLQCQLPMLYAYWQLAGKTAIDYYYVGDSPIADFVIESLAALGINENQIVNYPCEGDRSLIAIKHRAIDLENHKTGLELDPISFEFLRGMFQPRPTFQDAPRRIYVGRGNVKVRKVLNEPEVIQYLETLGFTAVTMDGKTMQQEADLFGHADVIIAAHGSALHNLLFARKGTTVIEIFPQGYYDPSNYVIANYVGCNYFHVIGDQLIDEKELEHIKISERNALDLKVDLPKLSKICQIAGVSQPALPTRMPISVPPY